MIFNHTPIELYKIDNHIVYVKREDKIVSDNGPTFSKIRGLIPVLSRLKQAGFIHIGYTETNISMAGWGVAWACKKIGLKCIIFDPQYKTKQPLLDFHRNQWREFEAEIIPIQAGRAKVNWYISKKKLKNKYKNSYLLPLGLKFPETIDATYEEAIWTRANSKIKFNTIILCIGSGTIGAGVIKAFNDAKIYGIITRSCNVQNKIHHIEDIGGFTQNGFFKRDFELIDEGWEYTERSNIEQLFPCHPWYDLKAWEWLLNNINKLKKPILFWNIGALPKEFKG